MKLKGEISIGRGYGGNESMPIILRLTDSLSHCQFLELRMSLENYARVLTNQSGIECEIEFHEKAPIGKKHEHKEEIVTVPTNWTWIKDSAKRETAARKVLKRYEVKGWVGRADDLFNHHNYAGNGNQYRVTFDRFVEPSEEKQ